MKPEYIFIHHTAVSYKKNPDQWKATDAYHRSKGWGGGGYNYEIAADGSVHQFRKEGAVTTAQYQNNMNDGRAISICLDGNFDIEMPTEAQKEAVRKLVMDIIKRQNIKSSGHILCHRSVAHYKSCPGILLPDSIMSYFLTDKPMAEQDDKPKVTEWAKDAWAWALKKELINQDSEPTIEMQRQITVLYRYDKLKS